MLNWILFCLHLTLALIDLNALKSEAENLYISTLTPDFTCGAIASHLSIISNEIGLITELNSITSLPSQLLLIISVQTQMVQTQEHRFFASCPNNLGFHWRTTCKTQSYHFRFWIDGWKNYMKGKKWEENAWLWKRIVRSRGSPPKAVFVTTCFLSYFLENLT